MNAAQQAAIERARARLQGSITGGAYDFTEEEERDFTEAQRAALERARARLGQGGLSDTDIGLGKGVLNAMTRFGVNLATMPQQMMAEDLAELADAKRARLAREAESGQSTASKILSATSRGGETPDELDDKAAELLRKRAQNLQNVQRDRPMSQSGSEALQNMMDVDPDKNFGGQILQGLGTAVRDPLRTAKGLTEVAAEQIPTIVAGGTAAYLTKKPGVGIGVMGGSTYMQERYGQLLSEAAEAGYDLTQRPQALAALQDADFMKAQEERGRGRGLVISAVDALTLGLASKTPLSLLGVAKNTGVQSFAGGAGEAAGEYAVGGEIDAGEVLVEALAEGVTAPLDVAALGLRRSSNSQTTLSAELTQEELDLQAAQLAEAEKAKDLEAEAVRQQGLTRMAAAKSFVPFSKFKSERDAKRNADVLNPQTEIGQAYVEYKLTANKYPANEKEEKALVKKFLKDFIPQDDGEVAIEEFNQALDQHAAAVASGAVTPTMNDKPKPAPAPEAEVAAPVEQTQAQDTQEEAAPAKAPKPESAKVAEARAYAEEVLGPEWETTGGLSQEFAERKGFYKKGKDGKTTWQRSVDREAAALQETTTPEVDATTEEAPVNALLDNESASDQDLGQQSEPSATSTLPTVLGGFLEEGHKGKALTENQASVATVLRDAFLSNEEDTIQQADGTLNPTIIAEKAGIKNRQAARRAIQSLQKKIADAFGVSVDQVKQRLNETNITSTEAFDQNAPTQELDTAELGEGMGTSASVGQGAYTEVAEEDQAWTQERTNEPDQYENKRQEIADKSRVSLNAQMIQQYGNEAIAQWRGLVSDGAIDIKDISKKDLVEWVAAVAENREGQITDEQLGKDQREIERRYATEAIDNEGLGASSAEITEGGNTAEQVGTEDTGPPPEGNSDDFTAGETKAPVVETKRKKKLRKKPDTKFGVPVGSFEPASRAAFEQEVKNLTGSTTNMRIHVFDTEADALAAIEEGSVPEPDMPMLKRAKPFGWVVEDENGEPNAHFILDRVPAGREKSAFLHEVGGHVGIDAILEENDRRMIATQIYRWAGQNDNSLESITARRTISRIGKAADLGAVSEGSIVSEAVAYFLEEAALAGVEPSTNSTVGKFVKKLRDLFLAAFDRLGFNVAELTAQDVIDLAYGAAYIELMHGRTEVNTQNPVTFSPSMTATENNGEVDPLLANREGETRFGIPESETQNQVSWTSKRLGTGAAEMLTNLRVLTEAPLDATKNLDRLIRENEEKMPSARKWFDFMLAAEATKNEIFGLVEDVINQSRQFTIERQELVNDFLGASTFYQKWGYDPQWTDRKTGKPVKVTIDPTMKKKYDRLTAEEQQLVQDVFAHGRTMQAQMQEVAEKLGVSKFFKFDSRLQGPYAPLKRFGNYVGELKSQELLDAEADLDSGPTPIKRKKLEELKSSGDHYVISFFESLGAAQTFVNANQDKFAYADASEKAVTYEESRPGGAQAYEKILGAVNANLAGLDQSSKDAMAKLVRDMYFQTLDDSNARLSGTKRLNRAGYDKNMLRAFAEHGMAQANLIAQMKHGGDISTALVGAYKEARKTSSQLMPVYNKIALKFQRTMTPRTGMLADLGTNVMKFNSFYMLTSSLGYFFQNMTQPYFAVAQISGEFGWRQAQTWGKLLSGYGVAKKVINTSFLNQVKNVTSMGLLGGNSTVELDINKAPPELRPVLKELQLRGVLDVGVTEDLRHVNMSPNVAVRAYDEMTHRLYQSARYVEANNRIASAVAAFKMAQANPQKMKRLKMTPAEFAIRIVQDTQGNFSKLDAPAAFDVLPRAPLQFRKYQFQMGWLHIDAAKQAFKGADPDMKKAGFRKLSLMMGYTGVFGGLASVPMANVASSVVQAVIASLSGDDEENPPKSLERWIRENVEDERTATLLTRGVPAALGWDFSQKLDQSDLFMPYNSKYVQMDPSRDGSLLFAAQLALGPTGTVVGNIGNISDFINRGNYYRAAEYAMPKGMRSYLETMRFAGRGYETRSGLEITNPTQFDVVDLLTNAIGLPSTDINQIKWTRGQQVEITQWFSKETARIKRGYLSAHEDRDRAAKARYRDEFRELQKAKDRVRPFFNDSRSVLKRASVSELIRAPRARAREQRRLDSVTGN